MINPRANDLGHLLISLHASPTVYMFGTIGEKHWQRDANTIIVRKKKKKH